MNSLSFFKLNSTWNVWIIYPAMIFVPILWFLSQAGAAPSLTAEQMDMGAGARKEPQSPCSKVMSVMAVAEVWTEAMRICGTDDSADEDEFPVKFHSTIDIPSLCTVPHLTVPLSFAFIPSFNSGRTFTLSHYRLLVEWASIRTAVDQGRPSSAHLTGPVKLLLDSHSAGPQCLAPREKARRVKKVERPLVEVGLARAAAQSLTVDLSFPVKSCGSANTPIPGSCFHPQQVQSFFSSSDLCIRPSSHGLCRGEDWLSKFGYLPPADPVTGQLQTKEALTKAIKAMQRFGGLEETGVLDQATLGLMRTPRCSLPDVSEAEVAVGRRRRSLAPQNKWNKRHLSWRAVCALAFPAVPITTLTLPALPFLDPASSVERAEPTVGLHSDVCVCVIDSCEQWQCHAQGILPGDEGSVVGIVRRVRTFPKESALLGRDTVRALMYYALKVWSDIAPLNFHEVAGNEADIQIDFTKADHNDGYPFDGPGGTVAHAFFPGERFTAGDTHFDDDEAWTFRSPDSHGMDLFAVAVHEFGHAIGLAHTSAMESIMRPYYQGPVGDPLKYDLPYEDKVRVWQLYGVRDSVSHTVRPDDPSHTAEPPVLLDLPGNRSTMPPAHDAPDRCTSHFDAVAQIRGEAFFFKGKYFWRLTRERHLVSLRPAQIHRFWRGLPANLDGVDAVYERPGDHKIVFFKGVKYWVFKDNIVEEGYPRPISDFGLPMEGVDAVFVWLHNDKTYFFKDSRYWRYDDHLRCMDLGYPKDTALWKGVPTQLDDAMRWSDSASYFFKGKEYWRVVGSDMEVEAGYPRPIGKDWLVCTDMQSDSPEMRNNSTGTRLPGQHHASHAENGFEVCSCSSDSGSPATPRLQLSAAWMLAPLWTLGRTLLPAAL
ncbi:hypothetical protein P4O66_016847 [Electrophorus voltai]|uniref:Peptidase metallopeptidase domain-containing protein n=1 Tax=Electrophorus voltai TaxID=2609070 RepID=A0AAD9DMR0_9TELE|nr:hypothetical protein P4O66_016847 [Electrophorus voltai]